jgi:hypothetical protein
MPSRPLRRHRFPVARTPIPDSEGGAIRSRVGGQADAARALHRHGGRAWVTNFADYDATYGALAGAVAFAVWLWISNLALLFGMVLDLELAGQGRSLSASTVRNTSPRR